MGKSIFKCKHCGEPIGFLNLLVGCKCNLCIIAQQKVEKEEEMIAVKRRKERRKKAIKDREKYFRDGENHSYY